MNTAPHRRTLDRRRQAELRDRVRIEVEESMRAGDRPVECLDGWTESEKRTAWGDR